MPKQSHKHEDLPTERVGAELLPSLKALADPTRLEIMTILSKGTQTVENIAHQIQVPEYNISKHLRILREAGLITSQKDGRHLRNFITPSLQRKAGRRKVVDLGGCTLDFEAMSKPSS